MASRTGLKRAFASTVAVAALSLVAALAYSFAGEAGWLVLFFALIFLLVREVYETLAQQPKLEMHQEPREPRIEALEKLLAQLPSSGSVVAMRLRDLLLQRLSARTGLPVAEAEARARELVKDDVLLKLLNGKLKLESKRDVLDVLDRIDKL
jgi:hypothetical protein